MPSLVCPFVTASPSFELDIRKLILGFSTGTANDIRVCTFDIDLNTFDLHLWSKCRIAKDQVDVCLQFRVSLSPEEKSRCEASRFVSLLVKYDYLSEATAKIYRFEPVFTAFCLPIY